MLFNSPEFLFLFLPITLGIFTLLRDAKLALLWLSIASLFFYGYWNPSYLLLLGASIAVNYLLGIAIQRGGGGILGARSITALGVVFNLVLIGYYKYAGFFVSETAALLGQEWSIDEILLPLAISFFTFQQVAYLVDCYQGKVERHGFLEYLIFVTFFPQLIAGPIVHHKDLLQQFRRINEYRREQGNFSIGLSIFSIGLFKKVIIADNLARFATPVFDASLAGVELSFAESWSGALAYTFQLYFDFSGYSDMAIGLAMMFGVILPLNFASPYKATSIIDFWRAWHMTLSSFLRDYLYIPLGGNRNGNFARYRNLVTTMLLGGLWHGAGWTFVIWGALHGVYLMINHLWRALPFYSFTRALPLYGFFSWGVTFVAVVVAWVYFRAESASSALSMLASMSGFRGISLPESMSLSFPASSIFVFDGVFPNITLGWPKAWVLIVLALFCSVALPSVFDLFKKKLTQRGLNKGVPLSPSLLAFEWKPSVLWAITIALYLAVGLVSLSQPTEFLYFQF